MILTREILEKGKGYYGQLNDNQIRCFGVERFKNKGWERQILDKEFSEAVIDKFLALKDQHIKKIDSEAVEKKYQMIWRYIMYLYFGGLERTK